MGKLVHDAWDLSLSAYCIITFNTYWSLKKE